MIGESEGADYNTIVSGPSGPETFSDFSRHPFADGRTPKLVRTGLYSSAAGRYQIIYKWWKAYAKILDLPDFSPASQDAVAIQMIRECDALDDIAAGNIAQAILKCSSRWASFPGSTAGQGGRSMSWLLEKWEELNKESIVA